MLHKLNALAPVVLRLGLAVLLAWFGGQQLMDPSVWTGFVPEFTTNPWIQPVTLVLLNGWTEVVCAVLLVTGFWVRPVALIMGLHLLMIAVEAGGAIGLRDFALATSFIALAMLLQDRYTLDAYFAHQRLPDAQV